MAAPTEPPATPEDPLEQVRIRVGRTVRAFLTGSAEPPARRLQPTDSGLFGPHSVIWRVHADTAMLVGGLRALLLQSLHPLAMAGVADHSDFRTDPLGRLQRTAAYIGHTTYGSTEEALAAVARVRQLHERVRGRAPDGRPYAATDPHLLGWVHATEADSFWAAYARYGSRGRTSGDADRYVAEMARLGELIGVVDPPRTAAELAATIDAYRPELAAGSQARDGLRFLLVPPFPLALRPAYGVILGAAIGLLPPWARRMLWLPLPPGAEPLVVRPAATLAVRALGWALAPPRPVDTAGAAGA